MLKQPRRGKDVVHKAAGFVAKESHQRVCDEVQRGWFLKAHRRGQRVRGAWDVSERGSLDTEMNRESVLLLPDNEEAEMYP